VAWAARSLSCCACGWPERRCRKKAIARYVAEHGNASQQPALYQAAQPCVRRDTAVMATAGQPLKRTVLEQLLPVVRACVCMYV
jgi:hypothetical protein